LGTLYPSAWKIRLTIASVAVCISGFSLVSNFTRNFRLLASFMMKPGLPPPDLPEVMVNGAIGSGPSIGPRATSSGERSSTPIRLVNQVESGTSSHALVLCAG
jgi:hypothetical protein